MMTLNSDKAVKQGASVVVEIDSAFMVQAHEKKNENKNRY